MNSVNLIFEMLTLKWALECIMIAQKEIAMKKLLPAILSLGLVLGLGLAALAGSCDCDKSCSCQSCDCGC